MLHNKLIVVPNDKVSGNVVFVCHGHYAQFLINELGVNNVNNITSTYTEATNSLVITEIYSRECIVSEKEVLLWNYRDEWKLPMSPYMPYPHIHICWTLKSRRNPTKKKFTVTASKCSVKTFSKVVKAA